MSLVTPDKIQTLQRKLYLKAKREESYRFYALYDKVCRTDILTHAYARSRSNGGAPGVDGMRFDDVEAYGRDRFLGELGVELQERRYRPEAVLRVMIPKPNGGERPLGIPCIRDRVVQAAAKLVLEPIFEADFTDSAYGYRPRRSAQDAVRVVHTSLKAGYVHVVDADLSKYFDTIPHAELLRSVARRVSDGAILHLVKMWLKAPIVEEDDKGASIRSGPGNRGTPQGGVLSPLLTNIYMRRFLKAWEPLLWSRRRHSSDPEAHSLSTDGQLHARGIERVPGRTRGAIPTSSYAQWWARSRGRAVGHFHRGSTLRHLVLQVVSTLATAPGLP